MICWMLAFISFFPRGDSMSDKFKGWYIVNFDPNQPTSETNHRLWDDEKEHNAALAMRMLRSNKFTKWAAAGMVGNMWAESFMSPAQWENPTGPDTGLLNRGYGLVQWTPATLYIDWAEDNDHADDWNGNGTLEIKRIFYERETHIEFFAQAGGISHLKTEIAFWRRYRLKKRVVKVSAA